MEITGDKRITGSDAKRLKQELPSASIDSPDQTPNIVDGNFPTKWFVRNVDRKASEQEITDFFSTFGQVSNVRRGLKCQTTAYVIFAEETDIVKVNKKQLLFKNRYLSVEDFNGKKISNRPFKEEYKDDSPTPIHTLPDEILQHVFSYLSVSERIRTEFVCKRWRVIGKKVPWHAPAKLDLSDKFGLFQKLKTTLTSKIISSILARCGGSVREIVLFKQPGFSDKTMELIGKYCPNLVRLELSGFLKRSETINSPLLNLAKQCPKLTNVSLSSYVLNDKLIRAFLEICPKVEWLELKNVAYFTGECFDDFGKNLKGFRIERCQNSVNILNSLKKVNNNIEELGLPFCVANNSAVYTICCHYKDTLKVLNLDGRTFGDLSWASKILTSVPNLEELSLNRCADVDDKYLEVLAKDCIKLRVLNVSSTKVTDVGVAALSLASGLKILDISCTRVAGGGIDNLASRGQLEELYACKLPKWANDVELGCLSLIKYCPNLRVLNVSANKKITVKLVHEFQRAAKSGFFRESMVQLVVADTLVQEDDVERCDGLQIVFENLLQQNFSEDDCSDGLYSDSEDDDDDYSDDRFLDSDNISDDSYQDSDDAPDFFGFLNYLI